MKTEWSVGGDFQIYSNDFTHDVMITINGDFESDEQKEAYIKRICDLLNAEDK